MRRRAPTTPLSPQAIKQIALITAILTGVLAMFVTGEQAEIEAAFQAREAKNRLARFEAEKLGAHKIGTALKAESRAQTGVGFEKLNDSGPAVSNPAPAVPSDSRAADRRPGFLRDNAGLAGPPPAQLPKSVKSAKPRRPRSGAEETATLKASAALRSGRQPSDVQD
ncbi:MAG: hypothetical protein HOO94_03910 [Novosphingobium sp.]|nr:hypothetical protein [Novosphingobium sp.]